MHSPFFAFWEMCYRQGWVTLEQLVLAKDKGIVTENEYNEIIAQ